MTDIDSQPEINSDGEFGAAPPSPRRPGCYQVTHWVPASDLGTDAPWICSDQESLFEADDHEVDRAGNLMLYRYDAGRRFTVAMFVAGRWGPMLYEPGAFIADYPEPEEQK